MSLFFLCFSGQKASAARVKTYSESFHNLCLELRSIIVKRAYSVNCNTVYMHFNSGAAKKFYSPRSKAVRLGSFNLLKPSKTTTRFKNYKILARIINAAYDVMGALEMVPLGREEERINEGLIELMKERSSLLEEIKNLDSRTLAFNESREALRKLELVRSKISDIYRKPGFFILLEELRKLDPSWSLLMSAIGDSANKDDVKEIPGFFYRARSVRPITNEYCKKYLQRKDPFACTPLFSGKFLDKKYRYIFSRRPFIGSFESNRFDFTMVTSHVVYTSPGSALTERELERSESSSSSRMKFILRNVFGVDSTSDLPLGVNSENYARFAETIITLKFMDELRNSFNEKDIILSSDFNIEASNKYWPTALSSYRGSNLIINSKTTLTSRERTSSGEPTGGYSSDYDHMILDFSQTRECNPRSFMRVDFFGGGIKKIVNSTYSTKASNVKQRLDEYEEYLLGLKNIDMRKREIIPMYKQGSAKLRKLVSDYKKRVFDSQKFSNSKYRVYKEVLSDHVPIRGTCKAN